MAITVHVYYYFSSYFRSIYVSKSLVFFVFLFSGGRGGEVRAAGTQTGMKTSGTLQSESIVENIKCSSCCRGWQSDHRADASVMTAIMKPSCLLLPASAAKH